MLCDVVPGRESWRVKVRVIRVWEVPNFLNHDQTNSIEMVLIDEKGGKIHATIRKQLLYLFKLKIMEGQTYKLSYLAVAPSSGSYRTTLHPYKFFFQMKTKVQICEGDSIPKFGLSFSNISDVLSHTVDYDYLVDVLGIMTGISVEREYIKDGRVTKMIVMELTDKSGKCEVALFGDYVDILQKKMENTSEGLPVVAVQFAKLKIFRDKVSLQNVMNTTQIFINPDIPEAVELKIGDISSGLDQTGVVPVLGPRAKPTFEEDFIRDNPKSTISSLLGSSEDGIYVVLGIISDLVEGQDWWYPACRCHRIVSADSGAYYCKGCVKHVFHMVPRFKVKFRVRDATGDAIFVVFDSDMFNLIGKQCSDLVSAGKAENAGFYPNELKDLVGTKLLFKVEKSSSTHVLFDGSFRVKRICNDASVMQIFNPSLLQVSTKEIDNKSPESGGLVDDVGDEVVEEEIVEETQLDGFVSDLLVTPETALAPPTKVFAGGSSKRNLSKAFEESDVLYPKVTLKSVKIEKE
ncbi:replication protein A 70 kDa DNA-binding subunit B-like [Trifolium pratense]|uniref:replication protein A 70 kDa DNA-binding subunit B-like n=1 Tax=Trifolium pratense TaxID=57577 RepID=UPI001E6971CF|nr:replication protein A 70 kDa DNA-binding subunit B-like [Trifolium pratense]